MMRLTLRTLLAYLDDVLDPADTKIIGQKIQESPMAQLLVSRIREVMRRRRLKAPEVFGPEMGIDPNIVSQYLDNSLPGERYADVERVLLASDEMLAETAACHQILTVVLGDPIEVSVANRERFYALGPVDASAQLAVPMESATSRKMPHEGMPTRNGTTANRDGIVRSTDINDERITTLPDYLKPAPWSQRLFPSAVVALLVIVCIALLFPGIKGAFQQANNEMQKKVDREKPSSNKDSDSVAPADDSDTVNAVAASHQDENDIPPKPSGAAVDATALGGIDPTPPNDETEDRVAKVGDAPANALTPVRPSTADPANPPATPPAPVVDSPVSYASRDGVVVRYDVVQRQWFTMPHLSIVNPEDLIANLEPYDGIFDFQKLNVRSTLVGESVVKVLTPRDVGLPGFGIGRGRVLLQSSKQDETVPGAIAIAIGEDVWKLELRSGDTVCALEVMPRDLSQYQKLNDYHWYTATLYVVSGTVLMSNREGKSIEIGDHMALNIIPERAAIVRSNPMSIAALPDWCETVKRKLIPLRRYQAVFEKSFEAERPIGETMKALVQSTKNPKIAELGTRALSATDNYAALVEVLAECPYEEARSSARRGLRQWLPMNPDHGKWLKEELEMHYSAPDVDAVYRMLWGFSREDVKGSKATSWQFTNWMRSQRIEIRELADFWVESLTNRTTEYRASAAPNQRESQVRKLEEMIERDNGLVRGQ